ncbi:MAG: hypothetical protein HQL70_03615 [Magnetococcales bacterium]|nr:hypothetical protein [Magnetococcales bacterium]
MSEKVTKENFSQTWDYILSEIESGRWTFADWPLENLQEIPLTADADGQEVKDLNKWINRHLKAETQEKMHKTIAQSKAKKTAITTSSGNQARKSTKGNEGKTASGVKLTKTAAIKTVNGQQEIPETVRKKEFEAKKSATEIFLSEKTRDELLKYRDQMFGEGQGSMELTVRKLLDGVERTMPLDLFQKLSAFQRQNSLASPEEALGKLLELSSTAAKAAISPAETLLIKEDLQSLLDELKG